MRHGATRERHRAEHEPKRLAMGLWKEGIFLAVLLLVSVAGMALIVGGVVVDPLFLPLGAAVLSGAGGTAAVGLRRVHARS